MTLPYGAVLRGQSAPGRIFGTYERSAASGQTYAVNRFYDARQGRFASPTHWVSPMPTSATRRHRTSIAASETTRSIVGTR
jgi:hypothetical protein